MPKSFSIVRFGWIVFFGLMSKSLYSQTSNSGFEIVRLGQKYSADQLGESLQTANLKYHRFQESDNTIRFDDGAQILLFSAKKMEELNIPTSTVYYQTGYPQNYTVPLFSIGSGNHLLEIRDPQILPKK